MKIVVDISENEWSYLNKLVQNGDIIGHYERLLINSIPLDDYNTEDHTSRKDAIKGLGEQTLFRLNTDMEFQEITNWKATIEMLEKLPSITPKINIILSKYQKIKQIIRNYDTAWEFHTLRETIDKIREVIEDGNDN